MALFVSGKDTKMNTSRYESDGTTASSNAATPQRPEANVPEMRAAPQAKDEDPQDEEPTEEPGYGHGV